MRVKPRGRTGAGWFEARTSQHRRWALGMCGEEVLKTICVLIGSQARQNNIQRPRFAPVGFLSKVFSQRIIKNLFDPKTKN